MNIFCTSDDPEACAKALDDRRAIKMTLESAQVLSAACIVRGHSGAGLYKLTHKNHPSAIWARASRANYDWLLEHFGALCAEYTRRFGKTHKSGELTGALRDGAGLMPSGDLLPFANVTPFPKLPVFEAYKRTLRDKWAADGVRAKWTNATMPEWGM